MELKDITQDNITTLIARLLTNDRHLQRKTIEEFVDDNVEFTHILGKVQGKAAFYYIYRLATVSWDYRFEVVDFIKQDDVERPKIAVWLNLGIKVCTDMPGNTNNKQSSSIHSCRSACGYRQSSSYQWLFTATVVQCGP